MEGIDFLSNRVASIHTRAVGKGFKNTAAMEIKGKNRNLLCSLTECQVAAGGGT